MFSQPLINTATVGLLVLCVAFSIATFYHFGPAPKEGPGNWIWPGTITATLFWLISSHLFTIYVTKLSNFDATYGPLATIAGIMLWFWVSNYVVIIGSAVNAEIPDWIEKRKHNKA